MTIQARLKGATRLLFRQVGSLEAVAAIAGVSHGHAGRYQHADAPDFITIERVVALESQEGVFPHVTQAMAAASGHILVARPTVHGEGKWASLMASTVKETGELLSAFGSALLDDGTVSVAEAEKLIAEADQAASALASLRAALEQRLSAQAK